MARRLCCLARAGSRRSRSNPRPADGAPGAGADGEGFGEAVSLGQDLFQALGSDPPESRAAAVIVVMGVQHRSLSAPRGGRVTVVCSVMGCVRGAPPPLLVLSRCCVFPGFVVVWGFFFLTLNLYSRPNKNHLALFLYSVPLELLALKVGLCGESCRVIQRGSNLSAF